MISQRQMLRNGLVLALSTALMALKPVVQYRVHVGTGKYPVPPAYLVLFVETAKLTICAAGLLVTLVAVKVEAFCWIAWP